MNSLLPLSDSSDSDTTTILKEITSYPFHTCEQKEKDFSLKRKRNSLSTEEKQQQKKKNRKRIKKEEHTLPKGNIPLCILECPLLLKEQQKVTFIPVRICKYENKIYARCFDLASCLGVRKTNRGREFRCLSKTDKEKEQIKEEWIKRFKVVSQVRNETGQNGENITIKGIEYWMTINFKLQLPSSSFVREWIQEILLPKMKELENSLSSF